MNIDDLADERTNTESPGERFRDEWLRDLPKNQWPHYIDESAQLIVDGIFIGDTDLTKADFATETGTFYQRGLAESANIDPQATSLPLGNHSAKEVGKVAWAFNQLREELRQSEHTEFENPSRAIEAAINKVLVERIDTDQVGENDLEKIRLPESATVSTLVSEVFCRPRSDTYVNLLLETVIDSATTGLLDRIEEPRMVTPLWDHQREALEEWLAADCRGYVDMATATGKTFLGLAAIAHHFGALHPSDRDLTTNDASPTNDGRATVVVIAHRDLILDQWKREFDVHLNIPEQSTTQPGEHTAQFNWGDVHFWTPSRFQNADLLDEQIDLVILDETHHYLGSSGFGSLLDHLDGDVLALSGSIDETNARTLERRNIPKLYEFTLKDGQEAGVIPRCDWDVIFTPYENQARLADVTERTSRGMERYEDGIAVPDRVEPETEELTISNLSEARSVAQSTIGRELKETNDEFREFASAVMARQLTQYNLSPELSTVIHLTLDNLDQHKCVVLLETTEEVTTVTDELRSQLGSAYESMITVLDDETPLDAVKSFDQKQDNGAIIGLANTLGEGVDIETADVCINRGRGRLSRSLVQRMGRILRNPTGDKHAHFYHITGVPTRDDARLPDEDGVKFLETASQLLDWGEGFNAQPVFDIDSETSLTEQDIVNLERAGAEAIAEWEPDHYDPPTDEDVRNTLNKLRERIAETEGSALLAIERPERDGEANKADDEPKATDEPALSTENEIQFVAADGGGIEIASWLHKIASAASDDTTKFFETAVREFVQTTITYPDMETPPEDAETKTIDLNPALDALLSAHVNEDVKPGAVQVAVATYIANEYENLPVDPSKDPYPEGMQEQLESLADIGKS